MQNHRGAGGWRARRPLAVAARAVSLAIGIGVASAAGAAPKTDVVVLENGDRITGEIKSLEHNRLRYSTSHMGTIYIEWDKIRRIETNQYLLLERSDGVRYYGQLLPSEVDAELKVRREGDRAADGVPMASIVRAQPIEGGRFVERLEGYVSAGIDYAKASNRGSLDLAGGLSSRTRQRNWSVDGSMSLVDDGADDEIDERWDLQGNVRRLMRDRYFQENFASLARNTELDLNLRTLLGSGYGRYLVQTNTAEWILGGGLAYSRENYTGGETFNSLEAVLTTEFSVFHYDFPETDIVGGLAVLPSLTKSGRYRAEGDLRAKYEFVEDLYFEFRLYGSYDSQPPTDDVEQTDYGFVTSLGYSF